jgi:hypothetical protein
MTRAATASPGGNPGGTSDLDLALQFYKRLDDAHVIRGIKLGVPDSDGNVIIVVGPNEYYAVAPAQILFEEAAESAFPRLVWVKKDAAVWRCQLTALEGPGSRNATTHDLSGLHSDLSARIQDVSSRSDLLVGRLAAVGAPSVPTQAAVPSLQLAGSVLAGHPMPAPQNIKHYVLQAAAFPTQSPWADSTDDSVPISSLRQGIDPVEDLAKICMITAPFSDDGLRIDYDSVEAMGQTLGEFVNYLEYCYRHPR